jgi:dolichyl-phosphate-mannose-protein mannosyltransferase
MASPSPAGSVRHRNNAATSKKAKDTPTGATLAVPDDKVLDELVKENKVRGPRSEWDYKLALAIITVLAFVTRFWGISHPNEVVFDEVHFGKVR